MKIDKSQFTHYASFYGVPCYFKDEGEGCLLTGRNWLFEQMLPVVTFIHNYLIAPFHLVAGFPIKLKSEIKN